MTARYGSGEKQAPRSSRSTSRVQGANRSRLYPWLRKRSDWEEIHYAFSSSVRDTQASVELAAAGIGLECRKGDLAGEYHLIAIYLKFKIVEDAEQGNMTNSCRTSFSVVVSASFFWAVLTAPCTKASISAPTTVRVRFRRAFLIFVLRSCTLIDGSECPAGRRVYESLQPRKKPTVGPRSLPMCRQIIEENIVRRSPHGFDGSTPLRVPLHPRRIIVPRKGAAKLGL